MPLLSRLSWTLVPLALACGPKPPANPPEPQPRGNAARPVRAPEPGYGGRIALDLEGTALPTPDHVDDRLSHLIEGERHRITYDAAAPVLGAAVPLVTVVVFGDYQCPYTKRLMESLTQLIREQPMELRVVFKHFPLDMHPRARMASEAAMAAQAQGLFEPMNSLLFQNQRALEPVDLDRYARQAGLEIGRFRAEVDGGRHGARVEADLTQGRHFGVKSTPTFYVNGRPFRGAIGLDELRTRIGEEREVALTLLQAGSARPELYARVMRAASRDAPAVVIPKPAARPGRPEASVAYRVPTDGRPTDGPPDALVTIVEFSDFQCPYCNRARATLEQLRRKYPREVRVVYRNLPLAFHKQARSAAKAALAADRQGKFWEMHRFLFDNQKSLGPELYRKAAQQLGLDRRALESDMKDPSLERMIVECEELAKKLGVSGTPSFFVNGRFLSGAQPFDRFEALFIEERAKANEWLAHHPKVQRKRLYERMSEGFVHEVASTP